MMFRPSGPSSRLFSTWRANGLLESSFAALLFVTTALAWIRSRSSGPALPVTRAEVFFLFPAPVHRRQLIAYKVLRSQVSIVVSALVMTIFFAPGSPAGALVVFGGLHLVLSIVGLHLTGVMLNLPKTRGPRPGKRGAAVAPPGPRGGGDGHRARDDCG